MGGEFACPKIEFADREGMNGRQRHKCNKWRDIYGHNKIVDNNTLNLYYAACAEDADQAHGRFVT